MGVNVFIDGQAGTTGLRILDRFANRNDITLLQIDPEKRKDAAERKRLINSSDYTFLCLPDAAAREAVSLIENPDVRVIDASTAHRIHQTGLTSPDALDFRASELDACGKLVHEQIVVLCPLVLNVYLLSLIGNQCLGHNLSPFGFRTSNSNLYSYSLSLTT